MNMQLNTYFMFRQKMLTAKREAGKSPARSRRCKRGATTLFHKGRSLKRPLWEDRVTVLIRKPEDLHKVPCNPKGNRFIFLLCLTEKRAVAFCYSFFYCKFACEMQPGRSPIHVLTR